MGSLERKVRRNEIKNLYGTKKMKAEWKIAQIHKYGIEEYAKMQHKSIKDVMQSEV